MVITIIMKDNIRAEIITRKKDICNIWIEPVKTYNRKKGFLWYNRTLGGIFMLGSYRHIKEYETEILELWEQGFTNVKLYKSLVLSKVLEMENELKKQWERKSHYRVADLQ